MGESGGNRQRVERGQSLKAQKRREQVQAGVAMRLFSVTDRTRRAFQVLHNTFEGCKLCRHPVGPPASLLAKHMWHK